MFDGNRMSWRQAVAIVAVVVTVWEAVMLAGHFGDKDRDDEMAHLLRTGFSLSDAVPSTGKVMDVSIALVPAEDRPLLTRNIPLDWKRRKVSGGIEGRARLMIVAPGGGIFTVTYFYSPETGEFRVLKIEDSQGKERQPNQALQTTSVTRSGFGKVSVSDRQRRGV
jgi:hypothetical protein